MAATHENCIWTDLKHRVGVWRVPSTSNKTELRLLPPFAICRPAH